MPEIDRIKREIDFHEKMFFLAVSALLVLVGWMGSNYKLFPLAVMGLAFATALGLAGFAVYQYRRIKSLLQELGNV